MISGGQVEHEYIDVLGEGFVGLRYVCAGDEMVVNSARVLSDKCVIDPMMPRDVDLINGMMQGRHGTPFEHNMFHFHVKAPIFVYRQWHRHRIGSFNEQSMRWTEATPDFYIPEAEDVRKVEDGAKKIEYRYQPLDDAQVVASFRQNLLEYQEWSYRLYQGAIENGIAPEQARFYLPTTLFVEMVWTVNARALMNFLSLRNEDHAQWEIRQYAKVTESFFAKIMPKTFNAWIANHRVAP